jgi:hypothetical protein
MLSGRGTSQPNCASHELTKERRTPECEVLRFAQDDPTKFTSRVTPVIDLIVYHYSRYHRERQRR